MTDFKVVTQFNKWSEVVNHLQPVDGELYNLLVTPDILVDIMGNHNSMADSPEYIKNREIKKAGIKKLLSQMHDGCWYDSISPVVFGPSGDIKDGQHRTEAKFQYAIHHGINIAYSVVFASAYETKRASDSTGKQNGNDEMKKAGAIDPPLFTSVCKVLWHLEAGRDVRNSGGIPSDTWKRSKMDLINSATTTVKGYLLDRPTLVVKSPFVKALVSLVATNKERGFGRYAMLDISDAVASYEDAVNCCPNQAGEYFHYLEPLVR